VLLFRVLKAVESCPLFEGEIKFIGIPNLENQDVVFGMAKVSQAFHDGIQVPEAIGNENDKSTAFELGNQFVENATKIGFSTGRGFAEQVYNVSDMSGSSTWGQNVADFRVKGDESHAVCLPEHHVGQAGRQSRGVVELGPSFGTGAFISHGTAGIQKYVTPEVGFFFVLAYVESIAFPVDFPIEMSNLISGYILPVLLKLDTEALVGRSM
jgi:hypothetical protein